jgi:hypothetical protein
MFSEELMTILTQVITTREVWIMVAALVAFMFLVNYVARSYHRPRSVSKSKPKKAKAAAPVMQNDADDVISDE